MEVKLLLLNLFILALASGDVFVDNDKDPVPFSPEVSNHRSLSKREDNSKTSSVTDNNKSTTASPLPVEPPREKTPQCGIGKDMSLTDVLARCYKPDVLFGGTGAKLDLSLSTDKDELKSFLFEVKEIELPVILSNSTFTTLRLPYLETMTEGLTVSDNLNLRTMAVTSVESIKGNELIIENNAKLESIPLASLKKVSLKKGLFIKNNPSLTLVNLGTYDKSENFSVGGDGLQIINNRALTRINLQFDYDLAQMQKSIKVRISGNPKFLPKQLDKLKKLFENVENEYIQDEGECVFPEPLVNLDDLRICKYVLGDLVISPHADNFTISSPSFQLAEVRNGSIVINGTNLSDLPIFNGTKTDGLVITNSCTSMADVASHNISYKSLAYFNNSCPRNCTPIDLLIYKQPDCEVIVGDIVMEWSFYKEEDVRIFKSVKKVIGKILLNGIYPEINVTSSLMFDNLEEIITPNGGTSMELWNLRYTDKFIAPRLKTVKNPDRHFLVMKGNDFLRSLEECLRLEANLSSRQFDPRDLVVQGIVTELIPIDEETLHFYDYQEQGADAVFLPVILLIPSFFILYD